ncbi:Tetraketide alpha-pyrone reductase 1 [Dendrobium catenatum]|uniref:Tetraketide alpha-pyrone reductase 1 n=1 Tax=Dendrobium catenatum TaxID=906689 RepID=A0A2I0WCL3_9ASPA|nr:Tetraketide alpha-pyrone reductase 1 [Dendrobium catenatum]
MKPALVGTRNVLKACSEANVKRVVVVSSVCSVAFNPDWPNGTIMDESCWSNEEFCREIEDWYSLSKTMAEKEAFRHAQETGLDLVTLSPSIVIGPLLQSTVNVSSFLLLDVLKGSSDLMEKDRNWHFVDVRDVADAALMIYEKQEASGRYICTLDPIQIGDLFDMLKTIFPGFKYPENFRGLGVDLHMSSEKLRKIGWKHRTLKEAISDSVQYYEEAGLLNVD